jgi:hypothetical protein
VRDPQPKLASRAIAQRVPNAEKPMEREAEGGSRRRLGHRALRDLGLLKSFVGKKKLVRHIRLSVEASLPHPY